MHFLRSVSFIRERTAISFELEKVRGSIAAGRPEIRRNRDRKCISEMYSETKYASLE